MNKSQAIFQEIENKLVKDDYASSLPTYHPAKGRRKRIKKQPEKVYQTKEIQGKEGSPSQVPEDMQDPPPEVDPPGEEEIQPDRDFPGREINLPNEEEIPDENPDPEIDPPDEEEFGR